MIASTRIFHTKSITACGKLIITALVSNGDLGGMDTYSPASQSFTRLVLTSFAQRLITIQYEISGLTRIFHTDHDEEVAKTDGVPAAVQEAAWGIAQKFAGSLLGSPERARRASPSESTQTNILTTAV